jgi:pimeloyl-ACP methyl ester carboxylesterase
MNFERAPQPKLEVLSAGKPKKGRPPLIFIHGGFAGAWCWEPYFLDWFAKQGWECHALSLRGHGQSDGHDDIHQFGIDDFVADVVHVAGKLGDQPILIGHSMGGYVAQRYLESHAAMAAVLMAPVPATGLAGAGIVMAATNPALFWDVGLAHEFGHRAPSPAVLYEAVFGHRPDDGLSRYGNRFTDESHRAWADMCNAAFLDPSTIPDIPIMVIGGDNDQLIPPAFIRSAARLLGTSADLLPGLGHALMLEPGWDDVAGRIDGWLTAQGF